MRQKKLGSTPYPPPSSNNPLSSPESSSSASILVPSSSPVKSPFPPRYPNPTSHGFRPPPSSSMFSSGPSLIRSSNIGGQTKTGSLSSLPVVSGSPLAVVNAINNRRAAEDLPRKPGESSLSYEPSRSIPTSSAHLSPTSPQQLSRLKARYTDESPTKVSSPHSSPGESSRIPFSHSPSLVSAKQLQDEDRLVGRLCLQFRHVKRPLIAQAVRRNSGDPDRAINEVEFLNSRARSQSPEIEFVPSPVIARVLVPPARDTPGIARHPPPSVVHAPPPSPKPTPKPRKNEKSTIYANRGTNGKRRDPDESESEEVVTEGDSEMDWSGDDGPKKKRRKGNEPEVDAEGQALNAFNDVTAEVLTGTIGE